MNHTIAFKLGALLTICILSYAAAIAPVMAHGDEEHEEKAEHTEMSTAQMEQMITILQQLVMLLTQYKAQYGTYVPAAVPVYVAPVVHEEEHEEESHDEHMTEATPTASLVIEVEPHSGQTHVHVRYTDKPEEMFFVSAPLTDEDGIVAAIASRTGLSTDVVRPALKYMQ